jgi:hypothetical protein
MAHIFLLFGIFILIIGIGLSAKNYLGRGSPYLGVIISIAGTIFYNFIIIKIKSKCM